mmetsp:Transcript_45765/g.111584  ORF Transcript_45765/g.111584 Transcript_45765/m.111584 type:complete len:603 (-) Transcript_45765:1699-3507(-)
MTNDPAAEPALRLSPSRRELGIATVHEAKEGEDVFIPLSETVVKLNQLIEQAKKDKILFIRAPVASGKTTLARYLVTKHGDKFVQVVPGTTDNMWYRHVIKASGDTSLQLDQVGDALTTIKNQGKTIVIDEAHVLFSHPNVAALFFKLMPTDDTPRFLLFSASGSSVDSQGRTVATPREIKRKYMWYPPKPDAERIVADLADANPPVYLDSDSVRFFARLCGGHRGILMTAMEWVQKCQNNNPDKLEVTRWNIRDSVSAVRRTFEESLVGGRMPWSTGLRAALVESRAVRVNGEFSDLDNIPTEFGLVLFGGPKRSNELNGKVRELTINGFLFPERQGTDEEFVAYDWMRTDVLFGLPNPMMAEYYGDNLPLEVKTYKRSLVEGLEKPESAADLIARALPYMTFSAVVGVPISRGDKKLSDPLSSTGLPYEDDYNRTMAEILRNHLDYIVSTPLDQKLGKTDIVVSYEDDTTCAIESIMAYQRPRAHEEHAGRFFIHEKVNYADAKQKALVIIGDHAASVKDRVQHVSEELKHRKGILEIIGLCVSVNHDSYEMYLEGADEPLFFVCDRVAKCLERDNIGRFKPAEVCSLESSNHAPKKQRA